ncbi:large ribosomal subunit protein uL13m-like [Branchiostoma floridae x Branchiostoma belcheri]|nr:54S ribosomal protein L13 [Branchiostoma belcheri]
MASRVQQHWLTFSRMWLLCDARWQPAPELAKRICKYLEGRHKPVYHPLSDCGDHVVVINAKEVAFEKNQWEKKLYAVNTGYKNTMIAMSAKDFHRMDPTKVLEREVYSELPKNGQRKSLMTRLHLFADENIPDNIKENLVDIIPPVMEPPKRLDEFTEEEKASWPRFFIPPADYKPTD